VPETACPPPPRLADLRREALTGPLRNEHAYKLVWMCSEWDGDGATHRAVVGVKEKGAGEPTGQPNGQPSVGRGGDAGGPPPPLPHELLYAVAKKVLTMPLSGRGGEQPLSPSKRRRIL
jgi:hypothetical protein